MKSVIKSAVAILAIFAIIGCGDYTRVDDSGNTDNSSTDNSVNIGGQDNNATDTVDSGKASDIKNGVYRQDYTQKECTEAGFFYCTIERKCLDMPKTSGNCNG